MGKQDNIGKLFESDVLVIGGGLAGLWAANKARESVERVLVVDNRVIGGQISTYCDI